MILELDLGNTFTKWRILDASHIVDRGVTDDLAALSLTRYPITRLRVASVLSEAAEQEVVNWAQGELQQIPEFARSQAECSGVTNVYAEPARLGVDRWLAMLAAYDRVKRLPGKVGAVVIDAGTALTIDYVDAEGRHVGGYILPGLRLSEQALLRDTKRVLFTEPVDPAIAPGRSTAQAVRHGGYFAAVAIIKQAVQQAEALVGPDFKAMITGGDAELLLSLAGEGRSAFDWQQDLVFDGLALALP